MGVGFCRRKKTDVLYQFGNLSLKAVALPSKGRKTLCSRKMHSEDLWQLMETVLLEIIFPVLSNIFWKGLLPWVSAFSDFGNSR